MYHSKLYKNNNKNLTWSHLTMTQATHNVKCLLMTNSTVLRNLVTRKQPDSALNMPNAKHA